MHSWLRLTWVRRTGPGGRELPSLGESSGQQARPLLLACRSIYSPQIDAEALNTANAATCPSHELSSSLALPRVSAALRLSGSPKPSPPRHTPSPSSSHSLDAGRMSSRRRPRCVVRARRLRSSPATFPRSRMSTASSTPSRRSMVAWTFSST